jgi:hypothetical protein
MSDMHREPGRGPYQQKRARGMPWLYTDLALTWMQAAVQSEHIFGVNDSAPGRQLTAGGR